MKALTIKSKILLALFASVYVCCCIADDGMTHTVGTAGSQDSTISVIGWFCKNDTMKYRRTQSQYSLENGDTVKKKANVEEEFMIVVKDSTDKGYIMELIPLTVNFDDGDSDDMSKRLTGALMTHLGGLNAVFTTDETGSVLGIENWKEIRDKMRGGIKLVTDSLYAALPGMDSVMPRSRFEPLMTLAYSTESGVLSAYDELSMLFSLHGKTFNIGKTVVDETKKDSSVTVVFAGYRPYADYGFEEDYNIGGRTVQKFSIDETLDMVGGALGLLMDEDVSGKLSNVMKGSLKTGATVTYLEDYNMFYNGWPCMMRTQRIIDFGSRRTVKSDEIEWSYRSWRNYSAKEAEVESTSF